MLSIGRMVARSGEYYIATVAHGREEYYTGSGESPGFWLGKGASRLGLEGSVNPDDLRSVLAGISPQGEILTAGRVDEAKRVAGFDLTWSAPKSVSLLFGLSDPATSAIVCGVHEDAVEQALGYLERHALSVRRGAGGQTSVGAEGLVGAAFTHRTSWAGDPQLHTHVLVANVAKGADGIWSAPSSRLLYNHSRTAGFLYQSALRAGLTRALGVRFGEVSRGMAELDGVPKSLLRAFSTRRREIEHQMAETGATSARSAEVAALATRSAKDASATGVTTVGLRQRWLAQVDRLGLAPTWGGGPLDHLVGVEVWRPPSSSEVHQLLDHLAGPEGLTAGHSAFERRDVARLVAQAAPRGSRVPDVEVLADQFLTRADVLAMASVGRGGEIRHTTLEMLGVERSLLDAAGRLRQGSRGVADRADLVSALNHFRLLSDEQAQMVARLTTSGAGVEVVVGKAGAGKTLALAAARMSWESSNYRVLGTALSARAARGLRDSAGIESQTLASLLADIESGRTALSVSDVVVLDEAGMVGTRALARLVESADDAGAKVVLVGDPRQLPEIEAGGAMAGLINRVGAVELMENRRQQASWERVALDALRMGRANVALATYERAGRIHAAPTMAESQSALVQHWAESFREGHDAVMLAANRRDVGMLNELARAELRRSGRLGSDLLEADGLGFASGDKVICLRNDRRLDVMNGTMGTVERRVGNSLVVETTDGPKALPAEYLEAGHLGHAYAMTVHKSQGMTVERAFVLSSESLSQESGYVAMSRATQSTELFVPLGVRADDMGGSEQTHDPRQCGPVDPLVDLTRRLQTSRAKQLALFEAQAGDSSDDQIPPKRISLTQSSPPSDGSSVGLYGAGQAGRGQVEGKSVGESELNTEPWATGKASDIDRRLSESRLRIADAWISAGPESHDRGAGPFVGAGPMRKRRTKRAAAAPAGQPTPYPTDIPGRPWKGLYIGNGSADRSVNSTVYAGPEASVLVVGPPRSGKTSGLVIPNVLNAPGAVVSTSTKPDVFETTMYRRWVLGNVFVFDPTGTIEIPEGAYPLRWSPVVGCDTFDAAVAMAHALGSAARPGSVFTESAHWVERAESLLAPLLFAANQRGADMAAVCRWVLGRDLREPQAALAESGHEMAQSILAGIIATDERERSGIWSTASGLLAAYRSEAALATTRNVNFDPARFVRSTDALYICAPAHAQEQLAPLVVALLEQIHSAVYARPKNAAPVVFVLDEVASIAPLPSLPALAAEGGGQGLVTMACVQDLSQARARWGEVAEGFFSIFNTKVIFPGIGDHRTLQLVSSLAGDQQVPVQTISQWAGEWGRIRHSVSVAPQFRPRLPIDQVARGVPGYTLNLSAAGMHMAAHIPWFEHKWWRPLVWSGLPVYGERTRPGVPEWHRDYK